MPLNKEVIPYKKTVLMVSKKTKHTHHVQIFQIPTPPVYATSRRGLKAERGWKKERVYTELYKQETCSSETTDLSHYKNYLSDSVGAFRSGTDFDTYREQDHSLIERVSLYTH